MLRYTPSITNLFTLMMKSQGLSPFQTHLDAICSSLYDRKFRDAEMHTLQLLSRLLEQPKEDEHKQFIVSMLFHSFNSYYCSWLKKMKFNCEKEMDDLRSLEHDNLLIAYCSNVYAMESLLQQAFRFFGKQKQPEDMVYYVENYKMIYLM